MTLKQKKAINNLREAWKIYQQCLRERKEAVEVRAMRDARDLVDSAIRYVMDCTVYYQTER